MRKLRSIACLSTLVAGGSAFSARRPAAARPPPAPPSAAPDVRDADAPPPPRRDSGTATGSPGPVASARALAGTAFALSLLTSPLHNGLNVQTARADEWGRETEAPTLFTGETVMICKKRGPLGACLETTVRTAENDNDKALKYFKDPSEEVKRKQERMIQSAYVDDSEGNALILKLRKQSEDNREKNELEVRQKTLLNDQGASFGPFDRQVVILNTDGRTFTLLQNPQAMRLKKAGYIEDRKFVIQPSQQVIDDALEGENLGDAIRGFFGGGGGGDAADAVDGGIKEEAKAEAAPVGGGDVAVEGAATEENTESVETEVAAE